MKISTSPYLSCLSMNPVVSPIQPAIRSSAPPDVWIPFCPFCFPIHLSTVRWIQKTPSTVCFGARDDSYGFFWTSKAGNIITFKLTHKSGYVTCHSSNPSYSSKWGCLWNRLIPNQMATLITDKTVIFFSQRVISYQIIGTASFTACLRPQPNRLNCSLITSLPRWRWRPTKNFKSGTARTCSNGVMVIMGTKRRVLLCMVCMFEVSPK